MSRLYVDSLPRKERILLYLRCFKDVLEDRNSHYRFAQALSGESGEDVVAEKIQEILEQRAGNFVNLATSGYEF